MQNEESFSAELFSAARELAVALEQRGAQIVFAESCTAGLVAASLATVPGVSRWLCGSAVTYQEATKERWLGVRGEDLAAFTAVSEQVATSMARGVLSITPQADLAASITGHLGPGAPPDLDGIVIIGIAYRNHDGQKIISGPPIRCLLAANDRKTRQVEAAIRVLGHCKMQLGKES